MQANSDGAKTIQIQVECVICLEYSLNMYSGYNESIYVKKKELKKVAACSDMHL